MLFPGRGLQWWLQGLRVISDHAVRKPLFSLQDPWPNETLISSLRPDKMSEGCQCAGGFPETRVRLSDNHQQLSEQYAMHTVDMPVYKGSSSRQPVSRMQAAVCKGSRPSVRKWSESVVRNWTAQSDATCHALLFNMHVFRWSGVPLALLQDSFLWDDGWDNPQTLWEFDAARFPRRFEKVASKAKEYGAGTGVWLSPWGGYGFTQEERVKYGKRQGYETNYNRNIQSEAFSLAGKKYRKAFHETAMSFRREQGVNMFKFDGVAGNPTELGMEMEAMLQTIAALRGEKVDKSSDEKDEDDVWINLTTGTWPSPFFLFWADSIWRGGPDIATRPRDWYGPVKAPDHFQKGRFTLPSLSQIGLDGLTGRQRWIRWRSMVVYMLVARRSTFFPLSQLMIHGVVVASHGDALHWELDKYDSVDFTQEVWSFVALGLQLQELYVAPRHMTAEAWDILAEALKWSRQHAAILRDSHWAFGDVTRYKVYCVASWDVVSKRGHMLFHNPSGRMMFKA